MTSGKKYLNYDATEGSNIRTTIQIKDPSSSLPTTIEVVAGHIRNCQDQEASNNGNPETNRHSRLRIALGISIPLIVVMCFIVTVIIFRQRSKRRQMEKQKQDDENPVYRVYYFGGEDTRRDSTTEVVDTCDYYGMEEEDEEKKATVIRDNNPLYE